MIGALLCAAACLQSAPSIRAVPLDPAVVAAQKDEDEKILSVIDKQLNSLVEGELTEAASYFAEDVRIAFHDQSSRHISARGLDAGRATLMNITENGLAEVAVDGCKVVAVAVQCRIRASTDEAEKLYVVNYITPGTVITLMYVNEVSR